MAARILSSTEVASTSPIRWTTVQNGVAVPNVMTTASEGSTDLRARIAEMEREMQTRVQQAYRDGEAAGVQQAGDRLQPVAGQLARLIEEIAGFKPRLRREAERDLVALSLEIARRVLRRELTVDPGAILGVVKAALERIDAREVMRIRVHPSDHALVAQWAGDCRLPPGLEVAADPGLEPGAVVLDSSRGQFDASIETQLKEIERGFTDSEGVR
jgi:flagellar assembly protein FliH